MISNNTKLKIMVFFGMALFISLGSVSGFWIPIPPSPPPSPDCTVTGKVFDHMGDPLQGATVKLKSGSKIYDLDTTDSSGKYTVKSFTSSPSSYTVIVSKSGYETRSVTTPDGFHSITFRIVSLSAEKIAVFFYSSYFPDPVPRDFGQNLTDSEGFDQVFYFKDESRWRSKLAQIDEIENEDDFILISIIAHGERIYDEDNYYFYSRAYIFGNTASSASNVATTKDNDDQPTPPDYLDSDDLNDELAQFESKNIMVMVGSCYAGWFIEHCEGTGRYIITASDDNSEAWPTDKIHREPKFEHYFYEKMVAGGSDSQAFSYAKSKTENQDPRQSDNCPYEWFTTW